MSELIKKSLTELAAMIKDRVVSPVEVAKAYLEQISKMNPQLNAIATLSPDLLDRARESEAAVMRGENFGALHGVPVTIKDTIDTAHLRTTSGSKVRSAHIPTHDAPAVSRLKSAGAIILGKTNAAEMAMDYTADNPVFGRTNHPLDKTLTPGGSSGGEAVAISTYMSPGGLGSDLAGSIRIPPLLWHRRIEAYDWSCPVAAVSTSTGPYSLARSSVRWREQLRALLHVSRARKRNGPERRVAVAERPKGRMVHGRWYSAGYERDCRVCRTVALCCRMPGSLPRK
jgi:hypothetical protein